MAVRDVLGFVGLPAPKSNWYLSASPSGSDAVAVNVTFSGAVPDAGAAVRSTVGARLPAVTTTVSVAVRPRGSVTVTVAVYVPAAAYVWLGFWRNERPPSPKSHA